MIQIHLGSVLHGAIPSDVTFTLIRKDVNQLQPHRSLLHIRNNRKKQSKNETKQQAQTYIL